MRIVPLDRIRAVLDYREIAGRMRDALIAQSRGECDTPMPMHLAIPAEQAEVHMKSSYRTGGRYFALKIAATFPRNAARGLSVGNGMMLLCSAETGEPVGFLADGGHLTDVRTAAAAAMTARELGLADRTLGILGSGIQARLCAAVFAAVLGVERVVLWGRSAQRARACADDLAAEVSLASSPAEVARECRLIVTCTAAREPLLYAHDVMPGTHIAAIGADSPGKQELEAAVLRRAALVLADSRRQCEKLGELQHAPDLWGKAVEIGEWCAAPRALPPEAITVADFTGLGVEDLYIAELVYEKVIQSP